MNLVACTARLGARAEWAPLSVRAVNSTLLAVAGLCFGSRSACSTFTSWLRDDGPQSLLVSLAAGLVACTPVAPLRKLTVIRACRNVALDLYLQQRTLVTTMACLGDHFTRSRHNATTASLGAFAPSIPFGHITVDWALTLVALARFVEASAHSTAVFGVPLDGTLPGGPAITTRLAARRPRTPLFDFAVNWAGLRVAAGLLLKSTAGFAAECSRHVDTATAFLFTATASMSAGTPFFPRGHLAVDGAHTRTARLGLFHRRTVHGMTLLGHMDSLGAFANLVASATALIAFGPSRPFRDFAFHSAGTHSAPAAFEQVGAFLATVVRFTKNRASAVSETNTTGHRTFGPVVEGINMAINGALETVAFAFLEYMVALTTTVALRRNGRPSAALRSKNFESAACLVASRPLGPVGHHAILRTRRCITLAFLGKRWALFARESGVDQYVPGATFFAAITRGTAFLEISPCGYLAVKSTNLLITGGGFLKVRARISAV